jgi:nucleotide-binding universal stress UspA family protein
MVQLAHSSSARPVDNLQPPEHPVVRDARGIRRILVCVDDSPFSDAGLKHAVAISRKLGSAITLLHVIEPPAERAGSHATDALDWEISRQEASVHLERLEKEVAQASGQEVDIRLEQGHPGERIPAVAHELDADLTVLGSHGERDVAAWSLGRTALQVLAVTRGSVLITPSSSATPPGGSIERILVPLDGSVRTESVLPTAVRIAKANDAELLLAFVVKESTATALLCMPADLDVARDLAARLESSGHSYLDGLRDQLVREGVRARTVVLRSTDEKHALFELSRTESSDLIVLSAHGSTCNPARTFGSVTAHLLTYAVAPLLVIQDLGESELHRRDDGRHSPPLRGSYPPEGS